MYDFGIISKLSISHIPLIIGGGVYFFYSIFLWLKERKNIEAENYIIIGMMLSIFCIFLAIIPMTGLSMYPASNFLFIPTLIIGYGIYKHKYLTFKNEGFFLNQRLFIYIASFLIVFIIVLFGLIPIEKTGAKFLYILFLIMPFTLFASMLAFSITRPVTDIIENNIKQLHQQNIILEHQGELLKSTLKNLKQTQSQIIQSEKMASLGQLIAGIAHEINTPLGVIKISANNLETSMVNVQIKLPLLVEFLHPHDIQLFFELIHHSGKGNFLSTKDERKMRRELSKKLELNGIATPEEYAEKLTEMNVVDIDKYSPLLLHPQSEIILETAFQYFSLIRDNNNVALAILKTSKILYALKNFDKSVVVGDKQLQDIQESIETVLILFQNQIKQLIEVKKEYYSIPLVYCFNDELSQVWTNIIQNAIHAMNQSGVLTIKTYKSDIKQAKQIVEAVTIEISDTGSGIPASIQDKIFEPFFTTKKMGEGSGLGLDIVKKIIEKHNGILRFSSEIGNGTTFFITLPVM